MSSRHSYSEDYPSQHGKCRACSDFKSWAKQQTLSFNEKSKVEKPNQIDMLQVCCNSRISLRKEQI